MDLLRGRAQSAVGLLQPVLHMPGTRTDGHGGLGGVQLATESPDESHHGQKSHANVERSELKSMRAALRSLYEMLRTINALPKAEGAPLQPPNRSWSTERKKWTEAHNGNACLHTHTAGCGTDGA